MEEERQSKEGDVFEWMEQDGRDSDEDQGEEEEQEFEYRLLPGLHLPTELCEKLLCTLHDEGFVSSQIPSFSRKLSNINFLLSGPD